MVTVVEFQTENTLLIQCLTEENINKISFEEGIPFGVISILRDVISKIGQISPRLL